MKQQTLDLRTWGGKRPGAGRKRSGERRRIPHLAREPFRASQPVHVSLRVADHVWNLRSERSYAIVHGALDAVRRRRGFRVAHFSIQGNHVHLIVEADGPGSLANGMRALSIRLARKLNVMMGTRGPVFEDRFHAHVLRTPTEVRNALRYVAENHSNHRERSASPRGGTGRIRSRPLWRGFRSGGNWSCGMPTSRVRRGRGCCGRGSGAGWRRKEAWICLSVRVLGELRGDDLVRWEAESSSGRRRTGP